MESGTLGLIAIILSSLQKNKGGNCLLVPHTSYATASNLGQLIVPFNCGRRATHVPIWHSAHSVVSRDN